MSVNSPIKISIIIPVKNGASTLEDCLQGIQKQTLYNQCEIIIIDSGSTDGTLDILNNYPVRLYQIPSKDFNHGATRNYGVSLAKGEFVVMTVQDAIPADEFWLKNMARHFEDKEVAGVYGQQIVPHDSDKNPHQWFRPQSQPKIEIRHFRKSPSFKNLSLYEQYIQSQWDDVTAMYRKNNIDNLKFRSVNFAEDLLWAHDALQIGLKLVYDTNAKVNHYHHVSFKDQFKRTFTVLYHIYQYFNVTSPNKYNIKTIPYIIYRNFKYQIPFKWIAYNLKIVFATTLSQSIFNISRLFGPRILNAMHVLICRSVPIGKLKK